MCVSMGPCGLLVLVLVVGDETDALEPSSGASAVLYCGGDVDGSIGIPLTQAASAMLLSLCVPLCVCMCAHMCLCVSVWVGGGCGLCFISR